MSRTLERDHEQVLVRLDRHRYCARLSRVNREELLKLTEAARAGVDTSSRQDLATGVDDRNVVMSLSPIDPAGDALHMNLSVPLVAVVEPEDACGDLMEALEGAASHQPFTRPATGRATVYVQASKAR